MPSKPQAPEETAAAAISHVSPTTKPVVLVPPAKPARLATPTRIVSDDSIAISAPVAFDHQEETNGKQQSAAEPTTLSIPSNHPLAPARKRLNVSEQKLSQDAGSGTNIGSTQKLVEQLENRDNGHARSASVDSPATAESPRLQVVAAKPAVGSGSVAKLANPQLAAVLASSPKTPLSPPRPRLQSNSSQNVTASDSENEDAKTQGAFRPQLAEILGRGKPSLSLPTAEAVEVSADDVSIGNIEVCFCLVVNL
jgi:hypothetical protein